MEKQQLKITVMELASIFDAVMATTLTDPSAPILVEKHENGDIIINTSADGEIGVITTK